MNKEVLVRYSKQIIVSIGLMLLWSSSGAVVIVSKAGSDLSGTSFSFSVITTLTNATGPSSIDYSISTGGGSSVSGVTGSQHRQELFANIEGVGSFTLTVTVTDQFGCVTIKTLTYSSFYSCDIDGFAESPYSFEFQSPSGMSSADGQISATEQFDGDESNLELIWYDEQGNELSRDLSLNNLNPGKYVAIYSYTNAGQSEACATGQQVFELVSCEAQFEGIIPVAEVEHILINGDQDNYPDRTILQHGRINYPASVFTNFTLNTAGIELPLDQATSEAGTYTYEFTLNGPSGCVYTDEVTILRQEVDPSYPNGSCNVVWRTTQHGQDFADTLMRTPNTSSSSDIPCRGRASCNQDPPGIDRGWYIAGEFEEDYNYNVPERPVTFSELGGITVNVRCANLKMVDRNSGEVCDAAYADGYPPGRIRLDLSGIDLNALNSCQSGVLQIPVEAEYEVHPLASGFRACYSGPGNQEKVTVTRNQLPDLFDECDEKKYCKISNSWTNAQCRDEYFYQTASGDWLAVRNLGPGAIDEVRTACENGNLECGECSSLEETIGENYRSNFGVVFCEAQAFYEPVFKYFVSDSDIFGGSSYTRYPEAAPGGSPGDFGFPLVNESEINTICSNLGAACEASLALSDVLRLVSSEKNSISIKADQNEYTTALSWGINVFPSLFVDEVSFEGSKAIQSICINDMSGSCLQRFDFDKGIRRTQLHLANLAAGMYVVEAQTEDGQIHREKIIKVE